MYFGQRGWGWLRGEIKTGADTLTLKVLAAGPIPKHVAFIIDGNRRYARLHHKDTRQGHQEGFDNLLHMMDVWMQLGVECISVYMFSIENFKRSAEEVGWIMRIAEEALEIFCQPGGIAARYAARVNVLGKTELSPESLQEASRRAADLTHHHKRAVINICIPYTSRHELTVSARSCIETSIINLLNETPRPITASDIDANLLTTLSGSPPLDILVRTSGVTRLSDFMLWQCCEDTQIQFVPRMWPELGMFDCISVILDYQRKVWNAKEAVSV